MGKRDTVLSELDEQGIDYVVHDETSGREYAAVVSFPLPANAVEPVLDRLRESGIERESYTVIIDAETVVSRKMEDIQERYAVEGGEERIAREELVATAEELAPSLDSFLFLTIISVVIATAGLLMDSPAVVVGSMVIAPLIGPAMATSVGTVVDDQDLFLRGLKLQVLGFGIAILSATAFAFLMKTTNLVPPGLDVQTVDEVAERVAPDVLSLVVALGAGIAGALSLRSGVSASLVGVMIAVALVPPTAVIGIGIAWGLPFVVIGSSVLVLVNALSINLAALATFWYSGYQPEQWFKLDDARSATLKRVGVLVVCILVLSAFLGGVTYGSFQGATTEQQIRDDVGTVLTEEPYEELTLIEMTISFQEDPPNRLLDPTTRLVVVTVGRPEGALVAGLADRIRNETAEDAPGASVEVHVVDVQQAGNHSSEPSTDRRRVATRERLESGPTERVRDSPVVATVHPTSASGP
jgi:uncharacterized hydrophobic protein (TIGR00341 family)